MIPNSVAADILQLVLLGGTKREYRGHESFDVPRVNPEKLMPVALGGTAVTPLPTTTEAVLGNNFTVPNDKVLIVTYVGITTSLEDQSTLAVNTGFYRSNICYLKYKINENVTTVIGVTQQSWVNAPILKLIPSGAIPLMTFSGLTVSPPAGDMRIMIHLQGVLVDATYQNIYQRFESFIP